MHNHLSKTQKLILSCLPLLSGLAGFAMASAMSFPDSLFACICMYTLNYQDTPPNLLVELARWTAPMVTASSLLLAFTAAHDRLANALCYRRGHCTAVYGPEQEKAVLLSQLGRNGIDGKERFVRAQKYILLNNEADNFSFYRSNRQALAQSDVYLQCHSLPAQSVSAPNLHLFCPEETAARLFWKEFCLYPASVSCGHRLNIVFLGFGQLGEELLRFGLQHNLFHPQQQLHYHIFGDGAAFCALHTELSSIEDSITFHKEPWYAQLSLFNEAHMVVVVAQNDQLALCRSLLFAARCSNVHVFADNPDALALLEHPHRLTIFDWKKASCDISCISGDLLFWRAKQINLRYAVLYGGAQESDKVCEAEWMKLDAFTRYSNISAADYHDVRLAMLSAMNQPADAQGLSPDCLELLSQLEHMRWCRYHYLNNWSYAEAEDGVRKNKDRRVHADLIPWENLDNNAKEKDRENIRVLLSVK